MIRFVDKLYVSDAVAHKVSSIKWKAVCGIGMVSVYFIIPASNNTDLFDIIPDMMIKSRRFRRSDSVVLGIAGSFDEATHLVQRMIEDYLEHKQEEESAREYFKKFISSNLS